MLPLAKHGLIDTRVISHPVTWLGATVDEIWSAV